MKNTVLDGFPFSEIYEKDLVLKPRNATQRIGKKFIAFRKCRFSDKYNGKIWGCVCTPRASLASRFYFLKFFYKQRQYEIGEKNKQKLSNTLRLNICYLKVIRSRHPYYHSKRIVDILKIAQKASASV